VDSMLSVVNMRLRHFAESVAIRVPGVDRDRRSRRRGRYLEESAPRCSTRAAEGMSFGCISSQPPDPECFATQSAAFAAEPSAVAASSPRLAASSPASQLRHRRFADATLAFAGGTLALQPRHWRLQPRHVRLQTGHPLDDLDAAGLRLRHWLCSLDTGVRNQDSAVRRSDTRFATVTLAFAEPSPALQPLHRRLRMRHWRSRGRRLHGAKDVPGCKPSLLLCRRDGVPGTYHGGLRRGDAHFAKVDATLSAG